MGQVRKIKAGLVKIPIDQFVGEDGHIFFDTDDGTLRLSDGVTPGGSILSGGGGTSNYNNLTNKPDLTVYQLSADAFSGDYDDLTDAPITITANDLTITKHLLPNANETLDLGSASLRFRDIYLSGETIDLGGTKLNKNTDGDLEVKDTSGNFKKVKASEVELDDGNKDATNKVVMRLGSDGTPEFKRVNKTTGADVETHTKFDLLTVAKTISASTAPTDAAHLTNKAYVDGLIPTVFSGDYDDLTNKPIVISSDQGTMTLDAPEILVNVGENGDVGGLRIFNFATSEVDGQELIFHTTQNGIHVGNDRRGTYTAGDLQINQDTDYGMLVGRNSFNYGSNNFGFGDDINISADTVSNLASGSRIDVESYTLNSVAFGGSIIAGDGVSSKTSIFAGGYITKTTGDYGFTWGNGVYPGGSTIYYSENHATGGVLFGQQSILTENATNSFVGGGIGAASENFEAHKIDSAHSFNYGKSNHIKADSNNSGTIGLYHILDTAPQGFAAGEIQRLTNTRASAAVGALNVLGSAEHTTGNDYLFAAGYKNEPLGNGGMCLGYQLKTPLNRATSNDPYEWEDGCTVVGAHNDPLKKFDTDDGVGATWVQNQRFVVGTGISALAPTTGFVVAKPVIDSGNTTFSGIIMTHLAESDSYPTPADARTAGVPTGGLYRTGNDVKILLAGD